MSSSGVSISKESAHNAGISGSILGQEDPLEKGMATHSGILAWRIPWTEEPGGLQSIRLQRVGHDLATKPPLFRTLKLHTELGTIWNSHPHHHSLPRTVWLFFGRAAMYGRAWGALPKGCISKKYHVYQ